MSRSVPLLGQNARCGSGMSPGMEAATSLMGSVADWPSSTSSAFNSTPHHSHYAYNAPITQPAPGCSNPKSQGQLSTVFPTTSLLTTSTSFTKRY